MQKPTLIFDFDSTLVNTETLEEVLKSNCSAVELAQIEALTNAGMEGAMSFSESLEKRLNIAKPTLSQLADFAQNADQYLTTDVQQAINQLHQYFDIWIISGGFKELITPFASLLGIDKNQVLAVSGIWHEDGTLQSLDPENPFCNGKVEGARAYQSKWAKPVIIVGDGATDYALFEQGIATDFIAYIEHAKRSFLNNINTTTADNMPALQRQLQSMIS